MKKVCFFINEAESLKLANCLLLANALVARGDDISIGFLDSLTLVVDKIAGRVFKVEQVLEPDCSLLDRQFEFANLADFDYIWVLGLGDRISFLDKIQLLWSLSSKTRIINSVETLMFLHSKYYPSLLPDVFPYPETYASSDFEFLWEIYKQSGCAWVVKPPARSWGKNVFLLRPEDSNARVILQNMTDYDAGKFCIMQKYVPEIELGEKRVLIANGQIIGQYKRIANGDHRTNIHQGASPSICGLDPQESALCERIGKHLVGVGTVFVGIDLVYPYVIEINVLSPGGMTTIMDLTGENLAPQVVKHIIV
jgi:glutathione synthase